MLLHQSKSLPNQGNKKWFHFSYGPRVQSKYCHYVAVMQTMQFYVKHVLFLINIYIMTINYNG